MDKLYVVSRNDRVIGVFTSHKTAVQAAIMETLPFSYTMTDYVYDFGVEFYTFTNKSCTEQTYSIQEFTPNERA